MLQPQSFGYKVWAARCPCRLWRGGSESIPCLGHCRELSCRAEPILQCDDVGTRVPTPAHRLLSYSLSLLTHFHPVGHHTCGWENSILYRLHWSLEHFWGRVGLSFKAREAQHWSYLQHNPTSCCMQVTDFTHQWWACLVCWEVPGAETPGMPWKTLLWLQFLNNWCTVEQRRGLWSLQPALLLKPYINKSQPEIEWRWPGAHCLLWVIAAHRRAWRQDQEREEHPALKCVGP